MMQRQATWILAALGAALFVVPRVSAQTGAVSGIVLNRPSAQSPSLFIGLTGGLNTGRFGMERVGSGNAPQLAPTPMPAINAFNRNRRPSASDDERDFRLRSPGELGQRINFMSFYGSRPAEVARNPVYMMRQGVPTGAQLASLSGLAEVISLERPLAGRIFGDASESPRLRSIPRSTDFPINVDRSLGLVKPTPTEKLPVGVTVAETIEARVGERLARRQKDALDLFRQATVRDAPERDDLLSACCRLMETVLSMDSSASLPPLVIAHASLVRGRLNVAILNLIETAKRNPDAFANVKEVSAYYGDRTVFDEAMRLYVRVRSGSGESTSALALEAYCAMALDDRVRAEAALDAAEKLEKERMGDEQRASALPLVRALKAALRG